MKTIQFTPEQINNILTTLNTAYEETRDTQVKDNLITIIELFENA